MGVGGVRTFVDDGEGVFVRVDCSASGRRGAQQQILGVGVTLHAPVATGTPYPASPFKHHATHHATTHALTCPTHRHHALGALMTERGSASSTAALVIGFTLFTRRK